MTRSVYTSGRWVDGSDTSTAGVDATSKSGGPDTDRGGGTRVHHGLIQQQREFYHPLLLQHSQSLASLPILEDDDKDVKTNTRNNLPVVSDISIDTSTSAGGRTSDFIRDKHTTNLSTTNSYSTSDLSLYQKRTLGLEHSRHLAPHLYHKRSQSSYATNTNFADNNTSPAMSSIRESPARSGVSVSRSHSFGGVSVGSTSSAPGHYTSASAGASPIPHVLGGTLRGMPGARQGRSQLVSQYGGLGRSFHRKSPKVPKVPRPTRALMVFDSVKRGIGEFIQATHEDIAQLMSSETGTSTAQGRLLETDKQIKCAERYLKRLEFHLAKLDELHDCYMLQQQLREGAKNMARAYSQRGTLSRKDSIANVKYGYKECSQIMCAIEAQLENMLGTFSCKLKGIAGFARLVPGDVFEVVIKHGAQKWKTKGRIEKNNTQRWDIVDYTFKCLVGDTLSIKASEVRAFKTVVLGQKNCEICQPSSHDAPGHGLFSANPQLMTVSINTHGSLKLSIIISWNPLDGMDETAMYFEPPSRPTGSTRHRPFSVALPNGSLFGSNSDLVTGLGPESRRSIACPPSSSSNAMHNYNIGGGSFSSNSTAGGLLQQRDDSGIYGSATSIPSHKTQSDSPLPQGSPVIQHTRGGNLPGAATPDIHGMRTGRPHSVIALDQQSIRSQPAQMSASTGSYELHQSSGRMNDRTDRPRSIYLPQQDASITLTAASTSSSSSLQSQQPLSNVLSNTEVTQAQIPGIMVQSAGHEALEPGLSVEEALGSLATTLEDFLGHYTELRALEELMPKLEALVKKSSARSSRSSSMSVSIEGAIEEAFDFLNTEDDIDDGGEDEHDENEDGEDEQKTEAQDKNKSKKGNSDTLEHDVENVVVSPDSTAKTGDSGIESLAKRLQEDSGDLSVDGSSSSPVPPSSGNEQVDQALVVHLTYCERLLENLGSYGPLKSKELHSLKRLERQASVLEHLLGVAENGTQVDLHAVVSDQTSDKSVRELWVLCVDTTQLYVQAEQLLSVLESKFGPKLSEQFNMKANRVFQHMLANILDVLIYSPELGKSSVVTVYQFVDFFINSGLAKMEQIAKDLYLMDRLRAGQADTVIKSVLRLREEVPSPNCLKTLSALLVTGGSTTREMCQSAASYLRVVTRDKAKREQIMLYLVEGLEDHIAEVRAGCCSGLAVIEAEESLKQLVHVSQTDTSSVVRKYAKEALYSLGETGRKAVEEAQLGLQVRKF